MMGFNYLTIMLLSLNCLPPIYGLLAYDCTADGLNVTTISTLEVQECPKYIADPITQELDIQVLQERDSYNIRIYQCLIEIDYHVTHCGMHSHSSEVASGRGRMLWELTPQQCIDIHTSHTINIFSTIVSNLKMNETESRYLLLAGHVTVDGKCQGGTISFGPHKWTDVVMNAIVRLQFSDHIGRYRIDNGNVVTRTGLTCPYQGQYCTDAHEGYVTWSMIIPERCSRSSYLVLYRGKAQKVHVITSQSASESYTLYSIHDKNFLATLLHKGVINTCGTQTIVTDHPRLVIQELNGGMPYFEFSTIPVENMDIFLYVNAKFTHLENHLRREMTRMYETLLTEQCEAKRTILRTQLSIASIDPVEFAFLYTSTSGHTGILMGEVVHIVKCVPVSVTISRVNGCYHELPVNHSGRVMYMAPKSHILQTTGTPVSCSVLLQPQYGFANTWFSSNQGLVKANDPTRLSPAGKQKWTYTDIGNLAKAGIYSYEDISKLRTQLMYPSERKAITQTISSIVNQDASHYDNGLLRNLITTDIIEEKVSDFFHNTWDGFKTMGSIFSGVFGIMIVCKIIKWIFDTVIHTKGLYEVYGVGWKLLASIWDAATTYLLSPHAVNKHNRKKSADIEEVPQDADHDTIEPMIPTAPQEPRLVTRDMLYPSLRNN